MRHSTGFPLGIHTVEHISGFVGIWVFDVVIQCALFGSELVHDPIESLFVWFCPFGQSLKKGSFATCAECGREREFVDLKSWAGIHRVKWRSMADRRKNPFLKMDRWRARVSPQRSNGRSSDSQCSLQSRRLLLACRMQHAWRTLLRLFRSSRVHGTLSSLWQDRNLQNSLGARILPVSRM